MGRRPTRALSRAAVALLSIAQLGVTAASAAPRRVVAAPSAGAAIAAVLEHEFAGEAAAAWAALHPAQQRFVPEGMFATCVAAIAPYALGTLHRLTVVSTRPAAPRTVPGTSVKATPVVVTVRIAHTAKLGDLDETDRVYAYPLDGGWRWTLDARSIADYRSGRCPA